MSREIQIENDDSDETSVLVHTMEGSIASLVSLDDDDYEEEDDDDEEEIENNMEVKDGEYNKRRKKRRVLVYDFNPIYTHNDEKAIKNLLDLPKVQPPKAKALPEVTIEAKKEEEKITPLPSTTSEENTDSAISQEEDIKENDGEDDSANNVDSSTIMPMSDSSSTDSNDDDDKTSSLSDEQDESTEKDEKETLLSPSNEKEETEENVTIQNDTISLIEEKEYEHEKDEEEDVVVVVAAEKSAVEDVDADTVVINVVDSAEEQIQPTADLVDDEQEKTNNGDAEPTKESNEVDDSDDLVEGKKEEEIKEEIDVTTPEQTEEGTGETVNASLTSSETANTTVNETTTTDIETDVEELPQNVSEEDEIASEKTIDNDETTSVNTTKEEEVTISSTTDNDTGDIVVDDLQKENDEENVSEKDTTTAATTDTANKTAPIETKQEDAADSMDEFNLKEPISSSKSPAAAQDAPPPSSTTDTATGYNNAVTDVYNALKAKKEKEQQMGKESIPPMTIDPKIDVQLPPTMGDIEIESSSKGTSDASNTESGTNGNTNNNSVKSNNKKAQSSSKTNDEFIQGLDTFNKLFEKVDPIDELDIGGASEDGASMQEVLIGRGLAILHKKVLGGANVVRTSVKKWRSGVKERWGHLIHHDHDNNERKRGFGGLIGNRDDHDHDNKDLEEVLGGPFHAAVVMYEENKRRFQNAAPKLKKTIRRVVQRVREFLEEMGLIPDDGSVIDEDGDDGEDDDAAAGMMGGGEGIGMSVADRARQDIMKKRAELRGQAETAGASSTDETKMGAAATGVGGPGVGAGAGAASGFGGKEKSPEEIQKMIREMYEAKKKEAESTEQ